jgi:receptor-type tyrosine-protein phosphatase Q
LLLNWDVPLPQEVNGIVVDYTINITSSVGTSTVQVGSNITTYVLGSLRPYIAYTCIIAAHTSVGQGPFSVGVTLTTPEGVPEAPPTSISQNNVMARSVDLSWSPPRSDLQNGVIRYYSLEVYENNTGNSSTYQTLSAQTSYTIRNLHPYYTYSIRILAVTVGPGPLSISHTVNTLEAGMLNNFCCCCCFIAFSSYLL